MAFQNGLFAIDYYIHPILGSDANSGLSKEQSFKTLQRLSLEYFKPGDRILLAQGQIYYGNIKLIDRHGTIDKPIIVTSIDWFSTGDLSSATIDSKGFPYGILVEDSSYLNISNLRITANGYGKKRTNSSMRCGILVTNSRAKVMQHIVINSVILEDIYFENYGFERGKDEVKTANGTQLYGWGIRIMNKTNAPIEHVKIMNCNIQNVSHTGIKLTGDNKNISNIEILNNTIQKTGGPGIQMSEVKSVYVANNLVSHSGSNDDSRKWGRGSGLWTWGSSQVLIEKNKFLYANGPGDSAGAHIDFNCDNVVLQYNISAFNAGGYCEILGNNYNCAYRYNISVNDGHRIKGVDGAFQEGKIFWLSGYQGEKKDRKGPVNSYFYNNTIFVDASIVSKIAIDNTSKGILIANNIFYLNGGSKVVQGDQYKPDVSSDNSLKNVFFKSNLFLDKNSWPKESGIVDIEPIIGNPEFINKGGINAEDYIPKNLNLVKNKGINIELLPNDTVGLLQNLKLEKDILGNTITGKPSLGAIEPVN